jgi:hypothetical protein
MDQSSRREDQLRCESVTRNGRACPAKPIAGGRFCFFHEPTVASERSAARKRGGRNKVQVPTRDAPHVSLDNAGGLRRLLESTINEVRRGEITPKVASVIGYLATIDLKVIETCDLERRLADLETTQRLVDLREETSATPVKRGWGR